MVSEIHVPVSNRYVAELQCPRGPLEDWHDKELEVQRIFLGLKCEPPLDPAPTKIVEWRAPECNLWLSKICILPPQRNSWLVAPPSFRIFHFDPYIYFL